MKIYEKPMATIEKLDVMDVITSSGNVKISEDAGLSAAATANGFSDTNAIVFEW